MTTVVLFSGGVDSALAAHKVLSSRRDTVLVFVYYGQNPAEQRAAYALFRWLQQSHPDRAISYSVFQLPDVTGYIGFNGIFPNRNILFCSIAAALFAADEIVVGFTGPSPATGIESIDFFDATAEFLLSLNSLFKTVDGKSVRVSAPLIDMHKREILAEAATLGILDMAWSCYSKHATSPCGECAACRLRIACSK